DDSTIFPQLMTVDYVRVYADATALPSITSVSSRKKDLLVTGVNFDSGAFILLNGEKQKTLHDSADPTTLTGKKVAKKIDSGQTVKIQVQNSDGQLSPEYSYTKP